MSAAATGLVLLLVLIALVFSGPIISWSSSYPQTLEPLLKWPLKEPAPVTRKEIISWWEARRFRFNLYVGAVGIVTWLLVLIAGGAAVKPGVDFEEPIAMIFGPFFYGFFANICYSFGWIADTAFYRGTPRTQLYKVGVIFSVILTSLPGLWAVFLWTTRLITGRKLD